MNYEKKYKEVLKKARKLYEQGTITESLCYVFPELKESEDERIRKALIEAFSRPPGPNCVNVFNGIPHSKIVTWLEKQGEPIDKIVKRAMNEKQRVLLTETNGDANIDWDTRSLQDVKLLLEYGLDYIKKLEKQSEQKPIDKIQLGKKYKCVASPRYSTFMIGKIYKPEDKFLCSLMNFCSDCFEPIEDGEQKPTNKVEPKFKIGDIITNGEIIGKVDENENNKYHGWFGYDKDLSVHYADIPDVENWHKWTIKDAKDGDVLCCESGWTCIFKTLNSDNISFSSYCFMDNTGWFCETGSECHTLDKAFIKAYNAERHPATKEQRDALIKAMADAGWEFDFDKKELKKIEQKPAWSEEDDNILATIIEEGDLKPSERQWLKSLKERVQSQPKQELSEDDKTNIDSLLDVLYRIKKGKDPQATTRLIEQHINFIKSLRERYTWKPSEEQMKCLEELVEDNNQRCFYTILRSLYEQLKKLREE